MQKYFDTLKETFFYYIIVLVLACIAFAYVEGKSLFDALWWFSATASTTGYGDIYPVTAAGRIVTIFIMHIIPLFIVPLITAHIASRLIVDSDTFTHNEQEELKRQVREIHEMLVKVDQLDGMMYKDLPNRLRTQAKNVRNDGWASASRLMINAADTIDFLIGENNVNSTNE